MQDDYDANKLLPFIIENSDIHGVILSLHEVADKIIQRHHLSSGYAMQMAQLLALNVALYNQHKEGAILSIGLHGNGSIRKLLSDCVSSHDKAGNIALRSTIECSKSNTNMPASNPPMKLQDEFGEGYMVVTLDQGDRAKTKQSVKAETRNQSILAIEHDHFESLMQHYFKQSTQSSAYIRLFSNDQPPYASFALLLQQFPIKGVIGEEEMKNRENDWQEAQILAQSLTQQEALNKNLPLEDILIRLFHQQRIVAFEKRSIIDQCRCSKDKMIAVLQGLSPENLKELELDDGGYEVTCLFCNQSHYIKEKDL